MVPRKSPIGKSINVKKPRNLNQTNLAYFISRVMSQLWLQRALAPWANFRDHSVDLDSFRGTVKFQQQDSLDLHKTLFGLAQKNVKGTHFASLAKTIFLSTYFKKDTF